MSEANKVVTMPQAAPATPAKPKTAIEVLEGELGNFLRQKEQAIANLHAIDGAIQATQHMIAKLKAEAEKAVSAVKAEVGKVEDAVEAEVSKVEAEVKSELNKI